MLQQNLYYDNSRVAVPLKIQMRYHNLNDFPVCSILAQLALYTAPDITIVGLWTGLT